MRRRDLISDLGSGLSVDREVAVTAAKATVINSLDTEDAVLMLDMLGLIPPQPGNEVPSHNHLKEKRKQASRNDRNRRLRAELKEKGATPEEIGEDLDESAV